MQKTRDGKQNERSRHPDLTTVHIAQGLPEAHVIQAKLEYAGIPALLRYESAGPVIGITVDGLGEVHVQVPTRYAKEAWMLIKEQ
ncbi:MAG: hypothetical protein DRJ03_09020 [Chloroflexi bacterium]|nr:MAG: hypothetical protein B6I35_02635 [Anaerolineaceae bacterium 4572_32.2]RLC81622.1 MAG: hypothetical protein DRI81_01950 [Chloroflexota bacterium]RLC86362.1 MAG: hypothetical protein DRJ03_09020 [Chloroflexota bacterium]HEY73258.1 hypothetical protein [Thermoflexia bacterium]